MNGVLDGIRLRIGTDNLTHSCDRNGCEVSMIDVPRDRVIVDADLAFLAHDQQGERCDFVVFFVSADRNLYAVPIELKSGGIPVAKTVRQLRKGAEFADRFAPEDPSPVCRPILIHGHPLTFRDRKRLNRLKVAFRGLELTVKTARCGFPRNLATALEM